MRFRAPGSLTNYEQETIINFSKAESIAHIFTDENTWQKHLEGRLGLKPQDIGLMSDMHIPKVGQVVAR